PLVDQPEDLGHAVGPPSGDSSPLPSTSLSGELVFLSEGGGFSRNISQRPPKSPASRSVRARTWIIVSASHKGRRCPSPAPLPRPFATSSFRGVPSRPCKRCSRPERISVRPKTF